MALPDHHPFRSPRAKAAYLRAYDARAARWPVPSECLTIDTPFGSTFVRVSGQPGAPPLVLLHGIGSNSLTWAPNIAGLSERRRVFAVDNIYDHGRSVYNRPLTSADDFIAWLDALFAGLGIESRVDLVGLSYGGWLATQYALARPERLRKLVLLAPVCTVLPLAPAWILRAVLCAIPLRTFTRRFMRWLLSDLARRDASGRAMVDDWIEDSFLALRSFRSRRLVPPTVLTDDALIRLPPTLYLVGANEKICSGPAAVERLHRVAPAIQAELLPGVGHDLTAVHPARINQRILRFLEA